MCVQLQVVRLISTMFVSVLVANCVTYFMLIGCQPGFYIDGSHERFCEICPRDTTMMTLTSIDADDVLKDKHPFF